MGRVRRPKILRFPLKMMIFEENVIFLDPGDVPGGFMEVPGGCRVVIWVYYVGIYVFVRIGGGFYENFGGICEEKLEFR